MVIFHKMSGRGNAYFKLIETQTKKTTITAKTHNIKRTKRLPSAPGLSFFSGFTGELKKKVTAPPTVRAIER